jgi:hypothetical protein
MTKIRIPNTDRVISVAKDNTDIVVDMREYTNDTAINQEDVTIIGDWSDYSGSGTTINVNLQGLENQEDANMLLQIEGVRIHDYTERGKIATTHRQRPKLVTLEVKND